MHPGTTLDEFGDKELSEVIHEKFRLQRKELCGVR